MRMIPIDNSKLFAKIHTSVRDSVGNDRVGRFQLGSYSKQVE